mgnify:CR=1 FL=1|jgi:biopolymer transport protein ExbB
MTYMQPVLAQDTSAPPMEGGLWPLFVQSFDFFTVLLLLGSIAGVAAVFVCVIEVREKNIVPRALVARLKDLAKSKRWEDLARTVREDESFVSCVVRAAMTANGDKEAVREAAELAASEESARWFRKIDILNVIGNLGPLVGLAGTVYGMILAFTSLGVAGGQAGPGDLSLGISKALFHTLLGLCLAIPCLLAYGIYRGIVDRLCTRGIVEASEVVEMLPSREELDSVTASSNPIAGVMKGAHV